MTVHDGEILAAGLVDRAWWYAEHEFIPLFEVAPIYADHAAYKWSFLFAVASTQFAAWRIIARLNKEETHRALEIICDDLSAIDDAAIRAFKYCCKQVFESEQVDQNGVYECYGEWLLKLLYTRELTVRESTYSAAIGAMIVSAGHKLMPY